MRLASAIIIAAALGSGCGPSPSGAPDWRPALRVTTAFGPFSNPLIQEYRHVIPDVDVKAVPASDSAAVVAAIESGDADLGLAYADAVFAAYTTAATRKPGGALRGVSVLEPLPLYILVRNDAGIERAADLRGRRVAVRGQNGLSSWTLGDLFLRTIGVDPASVVSLSRATLATRLMDGTLDAVLLPGWTQSTSGQFESLRPYAHLMSIDEPAVEQLRARYPFIHALTVPRVLYAGQEHPIETIGLDVLMVCRQDLAEAIVYQATKHVFLAYPRLSNVEATLRFLNLDEAAATPIPLHPGAARYFRERELSR
jgi:TRAP transporter TAXI family solute receptor